MARFVPTLAAFVLLVAAAVPASAGVLFVGSWKVDDGAHYATNPLTYTGQEAAALLFGGSPTDYFISTIDNTVANIDHLAWHSIWGISGGTKFAENFKIDLGAPGYNNPGGRNSASSAFVNDNATGSLYTNYAFRQDQISTVPEPGTVAIFAITALCACFLRRGRPAIAQ